MPRRHHFARDHGPRGVLSGRRDPAAIGWYRSVYSVMPVGHLYVHVPFCARRCSYCDFSIAVRSTTPVDEYLGGLRKELAGLSHDLDGSTLDTVYLGGGTPSRLGGAGIGDVLSIVSDHADIARGAEITIEANPDDVNDVAVAQ